MTDAATGPIAAEITARLKAALHPTRLEVVNESALHAGHSGDDGSGESHFRVRVESAAFADHSRVARQRLVNRALDGMIAPGGIHALAIHATAPGET